MLDPVDLEIAVAVAALASPVPFLLAAGAALIQLLRGRAVGGLLGELVAFTGGLAAGSLVVAGGNLLLAVPVAGIPLWVGVTRWRAGRRRQAGWLLAGLSLPWTLLHLVRLIQPQLATPGTSSLETLAFLAAGTAVLALGVVAGLRADPPPRAPDIAAPAGQPGSRAIGSIAAAIREPAMVGPFGLQEVAMLVGLVGTSLVVPFLLPRDLPFVVQLVVPSVIAAIVGTEAYIRVMPPGSRRAFEAFSWLGEWELARARRLTGRGVPLDQMAAEHWLIARPERLDGVDGLEEAMLRVEVQLLAGRFDEARALIRRIDERATTPYHRFEVTALRDLVDWRAGGDGDLGAMQAAADEILPRDGDDHLRALVTIAVAKVRRRMADGRTEAGDASEPLLEVRELLGHRADGQVGRALRRRLIPVLVVVSVAIGVALQLAGGMGTVTLPG